MGTKLQDRLIKRRSIDHQTRCWIWTGSLNKGYGSIRVSGRLFLVARIAYQEFRGPIPKGFFCHHTCDQPGCFNPEHMVLMSQREHMDKLHALARTQKESIKTCPAGHPYQGENLYINPKNGKRKCRACNKEKKKLSRNPAQQKETLES